MTMLTHGDDLQHNAASLSGAMVNGGLYSRVIWRAAKDDTQGALGRVMLLGFGAFKPIPVPQGGVDTAGILLGALDLVRAELAALQDGSQRVDPDPLEDELRHLYAADRRYRTAPRLFEITVDDPRFCPKSAETDFHEGVYYAGHRLGSWEYARHMDDGEIRAKVTAAVKAKLGDDFVPSELLFTHDIAF